MKKSPLIIILFSFAAAFPVRAEVLPNPLFSDGAVLQRNIAVPVWGTAKDGEKVTVQFAGQSVSTVAKDGKWLVRLKPLIASATPSAMQIAGENTVTVKNVLVGEVWICSGQSNMQWPLEKSANGVEAIAAANDPQLRLLTVPRAAKDEPQSEAAVKWVECTPTTVPGFSAVGYFFGRDLRKALNVPVGLINSSVGGTPAEAWTDRKTLEGTPGLKVILENQAKAEAAFDPAKLVEQNKKIQEKYQQDVEKAQSEGKPKPPAPRLASAPKDNIRRPCGLYNAMIAPLQPYAIAGAIWYQGESNNGNPLQYQTLFPAMISNWRAAWGQGAFPFLFVQIAPYKDMKPELREAQLVSWQKTPGTAMAVITDVGDAKDIHPTKKEPVGGRLALAARALAYGDRIEYSGPVYDSKTVDGGKIVLSFKHVGQGLVAKDGELKGFTIAGADKQFVPAEAKIVGSTVVVSSPDVPAPLAVRYGWANVPDVNFFNKDGLPATPFRTDADK